MPRKVRDYKAEYANQQDREHENPRRAARARARRDYDARGIDRNGKDIDHKTPLSKGGSDKSHNTRLVKPSTNRSFARTSSGKIK